jgi:hypothetical protein
VCLDESGPRGVWGLWVVRGLVETVSLDESPLGGLGVCVGQRTRRPLVGTRRVSTRVSGMVWYSPLDLRPRAACGLVQSLGLTSAGCLWFGYVLTKHSAHCSVVGLGLRGGGVRGLSLE